jgi:hypothetical protein
VVRDRDGQLRRKDDHRKVHQHRVLLASFTGRCAANPYPKST